MWVARPTNVVVPGPVELGGVRQAALHDVHAVVVTRAHVRDALAVGAVHHLHQRRST